MKKRLTITLLILVTCMLSVYAESKFWIGTGFISQTDYIPEEFKLYYKNHSPNLRDEYGNLIYDIEIRDYIKDPSKLKSLNMLGPSLDLIFFPYYQVPIGLKISDQILFPIGYNNGSWTRSYNGDLKNRLNIGIEYDQSFNNWGFFIEGTFFYDYIRMAQNNKKNSTLPPDFIKFSNYGLSTSAGLLTTTSFGYFKFGFNYAYGLQHNTHSTDLIISGGIIL